MHSKPFQNKKGSDCNSVDLGSIPGWGRSPGGRNDSPLLYSRLGNSTDRRGWRDAVHRVAKSRTGRSNSHTHTHTEGHGDTPTRATRTWKRRRFRPSSRTSRCTWTGIRLEPCTLSTQGQEAAPQVASSCGPKHKAVYGAHPPSQRPLPRQNPGEPGPVRSGGPHPPPHASPAESQGGPPSPPLRPPSRAGSHQLPEPRGVVLVVKAGREDEGGRRALVLSRVSIT